MNERDKDNNEYYTDEDYLDMAGTSSANECTGLISQGSNETDSAQQYNDLYQFGVPHVAAKAARKSSKEFSTSASDKLSSNTSVSASDISSTKASNKSSANQKKQS